MRELVVCAAIICIALALIKDCTTQNDVCHGNFTVIIVCKDSIVSDSVLRNVMIMRKIWEE